mmetsp:Transcript_6927/g.17957  ORF Transcript_6927/g.17957 Transcript_6927/m.17957 type:complete len:214 (+) Transcript_6927:1343-1984(+)
MLMSGLPVNRRILKSVAWRSTPCVSSRRLSTSRSSTLARWNLLHFRNARQWLCSSNILPHLRGCDRVPQFSAALPICGDAPATCASSQESRDCEAVHGFTRSGEIPEPPPVGERAPDVPSRPTNKVEEEQAGCRRGRLNHTTLGSTDDTSDVCSGHLFAELSRSAKAINYVVVSGRRRATFALRKRGGRMSRGDACDRLRQQNIDRAAPGIWS